MSNRKSAKYGRFMAVNLLIAAIIGTIVALILSAFGLTHDAGYLWLHILVIAVIVVTVSGYLDKKRLSPSGGAPRSLKTDIEVVDEKGNLLAKVTDDRVLNIGLSAVSGGGGSIFLNHGGADVVIVSGVSRGNLVIEGNIRLGTLSISGDLTRKP